VSEVIILVISCSLFIFIGYGFQQNTGIGIANRRPQDGTTSTENQGAVRATGETTTRTSNKIP
jgi:hypothetical protein